MEEEKKPVGRARLAMLIGQHKKSPGIQSSEARSSDENKDVSVMKPKKIGRGELVQRIIDEELRQKKMAAEVAEKRGTSAKSLENVSDMLSKIRLKLHKKEHSDEDSKKVERDPAPEQSEINKQGSYGIKKMLLSNYVQLKVEPNKCVFQYLIKFNPEVDNVSYRYKLLYKQFREKKDMLCFDGTARLFTPEKLTDDVVTYSLEHPSGQNVTIKVKFAGVARGEDCAFIYNTLFNNISRILSMTRHKTKFYDPRAAQKIPQHRLEIWPGVVTTVDVFDGGIQLRCDTHHRILRTETAYDVIASVIRRNPENFKPLVAKQLLGEVVSTRYNNNLYRVDDVDWNLTPLSTFEVSKTPVKFIDYYKNQYNIDIKDLKQPLLITKSKYCPGKSPLICLVPELCNMTGLTDKMRSDFRMMKDIALYTRISPAQRAYAFRKFIENIQENEEAREKLKKWGLSIDPELVKMEGRNLQFESLILGQNVPFPTENGMWHKCFRNATVFHSVDLTRWTVFFPESVIRAATNFKNLLRKIGPGLGIDIREPTMFHLKDDKPETYLHALREKVDERLQIVVCICPTSRDDRYALIKKFCCKEVPIPSQIINATTLACDERTARPIVLNIALQMNAKLGGASWVVHIPFKNTMVCGMDVYHNPSGGPSFAAFVASCNSTHSEWFSSVKAQGPSEELFHGIVHMFKSSLENYRQKRDCYPERVVIYRDGINKSAMETCVNFEIPQFERVLQQIQPNIKFTFIIVQKRIQTKFYQIMENDEEKPENPCTGDIVDQIITEKKFFDFYLVSQYVRQGTATPCHYIVLYDNSNIKPDHVQRLTYKFCHLYYNWMGTVRVPAPCQYAHKLAYLVGQHVRSIPDATLNNKLYYL